jgi:hypothetical protein
MKLHMRSIADPGSGAFLTPAEIRDPEWVKKTKSESGNPGSYLRELRNNFLC